MSGKMYWNNFRQDVLEQFQAGCIGTISGRMYWNNFRGRMYWNNFRGKMGIQQFLHDRFGAKIKFKKTG